MTSRVAANDTAIPAAPDLCQLAIDLIVDCGDDAPRVASERALRAFWAGDMAGCKRWTRAARLIDHHFAAHVVAFAPPVRHAVPVVAV